VPGGWLPTIYIVKAIEILRLWAAQIFTEQALTGKKALLTA
jgi:hypothetical protein